MADSIALTVNGKEIVAPRGASVLEAGLRAGIRMPHECDIGLCESCRVRLVAGSLGEGDPIGAGILACKATLLEAASITFDPSPLEMKTTGVVRSIISLSRDISEIIVEVSKPVPYLPGQYVRAAFASLPERSYCPTLSLEGLREVETLYFHVRRFAGGKVSDALGKVIHPGTRVKIRGPFGQGFLRHGEGRLVLLSSGAGFSAIWSIAVAARLGQPHRPLVIVASARDPRNLYMRPALDWLAKHDVAEIVIVASAACPFPPARHGRASDFLPALLPSDTVHVAGEPEMVRAVMRASLAAKAKVYGVPLAQVEDAPTFSNRISGLFGAKHMKEKARLEIAAKRKVGTAC